MRKINLTGAVVVDGVEVGVAHQREDQHAEGERVGGLVSLVVKLNLILLQHLKLFGR